MNKHPTSPMALNDKELQKEQQQYQQQKKIIIL